MVFLRIFGFDGFKVVCFFGIGNRVIIRFVVVMEVYGMIWNYFGYIWNYFVIRILKLVVFLGIVMEGFLGRVSEWNIFKL